MKFYKVAAGIALLASILLLVLPRIIPICNGLAPNGKPMLCHYAYQADFVVALIALTLSLGLFVLKTYEARILGGLTIALLGAASVVLLQPWAVGICQHAGSCHKTSHFISITGAILMVAAVAVIYTSYRVQQQVTTE